MTVDVHTHLPSHRDTVPAAQVREESTMRSGQTVRLTNSIQDYLKDMAPVDRTLVFGIAPRPWKPNDRVLATEGWPSHMNWNDVAAEVAKASYGKAIAAMSLHPQAPDVMEEYDRAVDDLGCRAIKLGPNYQDFDPTGREAFRLFARLEHDGIPIIFHTGTSPMTEAPLTYAHPLTLDKVAMAFPRLKMVLAHLSHPWQGDCLSVVRKHPNVWADVSAQFYRPYSFWQGMRLFYEWGVSQKILFASDWPVTRPQDNIDSLRGLEKFATDHHLPAIPYAEIEGIINRDALDILGLD
jgi:predicted TIM-barrel fold metal-dependent hydrolase